MTILVTGAGGMLGANLCCRLVQQGETVRTFTRQSLTHPLLAGLELDERCGDLLDTDALSAAMSGCSYVFHAAGRVSYRLAEKEGLFRDNVAATRSVLQAAAATGVRRVIYTSSTAAVGLEGLDGLPLTEDSPFDSRCQRIPYMASKHAAEQLALKSRGVEVVVVNPATIFGAGDMKFNSGKIFQHVQTGRMRYCPPGGCGVISVQDCVDGHIAAWRLGQPGRRYILCAGNYLFRELFACIGSQLGVRAPNLALPLGAFWIVYVGCGILELLGPPLGMNSFPRHGVLIAFRKRFFEAERARRELGWKPRQTIDVMFSEAIAFYQEHGLLAINGRAPVSLRSPVDSSIRSGLSERHMSDEHG